MRVRCILKGSKNILSGDRIYDVLSEYDDFYNVITDTGLRLVHKRFFEIIEKDTYKIDDIVELIDENYIDCCEWMVVGDRYVITDIDKDGGALLRGLFRNEHTTIKDLKKSFKKYNKLPNKTSAKFYEFNEGYYAMISALNVQDAKLGYIKEIEEDMNINDLNPTEISIEEAKKKCLSVDIKDYPQTKKEKLEEFDKYFYHGDYSQNKYKLVLVDGWLL